MLLHAALQTHLVYAGDQVPEFVMVNIRGRCKSVFKHVTGQELDETLTLLPYTGRNFDRQGIYFGIECKGRKLTFMVEKDDDGIKFQKDVSNATSMF